MNDINKLIILYFALILLYGILVFLVTKKYYEKKLPKEAKQREFLKNFYMLFAILIVLFPPQYYPKQYMYDKFGKFNFILNSNAVDIYYFIYELIAFLFIGAIYYFLFLYKRKKVNDITTI